VKPAGIQSENAVSPRHYISALEIAGKLGKRSIAHTPERSAPYVRSTKTQALATASAIALITMLVHSRPATAQPAATPTVEQVEVTSTRITASGFDAPTPTTVVSLSQIQNQAEPNIFTVVNMLPELQGSAAPETGTTSSSAGTDGLSVLNLRSLGQTRTLVLLDGQRIVGSNTTGVVDVSQLPQGLIQRVDVVTGGASASWGSDAVAGVVNFILDKNFTGIKGNIEGGITTYGDDQTGTLDLSVGTGFDHDRGHIEFSGEFSNSPGVGAPQNTSRTWYQGYKILENTIAGTPAGQPEYIASAHVTDELLAPGGIITGQGTSLSSSIVGTTFGANGQISQYQYGSPIINPYQIGGPPSSDEGGNGAWLESALQRSTLYGRISYDITPNITVYGTINYGEVHTHNVAFLSTYKPGNLTIQCDNAYLPASISTACGGAGHSFTFGTENVDLPNVDVDNVRTQRRYVLGADGNYSLFDKKWTWSTYYQHGEDDVINNNFNQTDTPLYNQAIDAVAGPGGSIVCRSAVAQAQGCVPINVFGTNTVNSTPGAYPYFEGTAYMQTYLRQDAASLSTNGQLFSTWAGPVSLATGAEYRQEAFHQRADCISNGACSNSLLSSAGNNWFSGNFHPSRGNFHVYEAFVETVVPLLNDNNLGSADIDLAGRATDYSTSGYVQTWKAGLNYTPGFLPSFLEGLRFRALQSRDIRAPNLSELFGAPSTPTGGVIDDFGPSKGQNFIVHEPTISNLALKPEKSQTSELGIVFQPTWLPGFQTSIDYYRIAVKGEIGTVTAQQTMDLCAAGNQTLCNNIEFGPGQIPTFVTVQDINLAAVTTDGFDVDASYNVPMSSLIDGVDGNLGITSNLTHVSKFITNTGIVGQPLFETAGMNSGSVPLWRWLASETYDTDEWGVSVTERYTSAGVINTAYVQCTSSCPLPTVNNPTINNNQMGDAFYLDVGGHVNLPKIIDGLESEFYFKIDNVLDKDPAPDPQFGSLPINLGVNPTLYDTLGRFYHIGIRFND
jgi:iron complex outermembrane receptor protein